jgi:Amidase
VGADTIGHSDPSFVDFAAAHAQAETLRSAFSRFFRKYDLLLTPVNPMTATPYGAQEVVVNGVTVPWTYVMAATSPFNLAGLPQCRSRREPCPVIVWEDSQEVDLMVLFNMDLIISLELVTTLVTIVSLHTTKFFASTAVSSSVLTSLASGFLISGTLTTTTATTDIHTITSLTTIHPYTITGIGTVWAPRSKRSLPGVVITTDRLTE